MNAHRIGIRSIATALPEKFTSLEELPITSDAGTLRGFGFEGAFIGDDAAVLAGQAAKQALVNADLAAREIDVLLWVSALAENHHRSSESNNAPGLLDRFCYQASWLQEEIGLDRASVSAVAQQGCAGMFSAMRQARALLAAEPDLQHVMCVGADVFPAGAQREVLYNIVSDAACACVVSREAIQYRWLGFNQVSKGYYWDVPLKQSEIIAAYFPSAALTIRGLLRKLEVNADDIDLVIPTGVNASSWPVLLRMCGICEDRLYQPQHRSGHTISADSFLMLEEARRRGALRPGMKLLIFAYGFGSSWFAILLETTDLICA